MISLIVESLNYTPCQPFGALLFHTMSTMTTTTMDGAGTALAPPPRLPEELLASDGFLVKRLGMIVKEQAMEAYEASGLRPYHHAVLAVLDEGTRETQGAIADALGYDRGQLVGLLDELEQHGLIERRRDPSDRRRHVVKMTPAGKRALGKFRAIAQKLDTEFLSPLDDTQREQLHALLCTLGRFHCPRVAQSLIAQTPAAESVPVASASD